ncbi:S-antigen protein [Tupaia chinensis]|uniref:S-antigen protein n=1 Tax=Tupaia chinensis TaxID=246437 RepID=L9JEW2_TUPCH|nr:S-antigen protein [Tupaia chinensis]
MLLCWKSREARRPELRLPLSTRSTGSRAPVLPTSLCGKALTAVAVAGPALSRASLLWAQSCAAPPGLLGTLPDSVQSPGCQVPLGSFDPSTAKALLPVRQRQVLELAVGVWGLSFSGHVLADAGVSPGVWAGDMTGMVPAGSGQQLWGPAALLPLDSATGGELSFPASRSQFSGCSSEGTGSLASVAPGPEPPTSISSRLQMEAARPWPVCLNVAVRLVSVAPGCLAGSRSVHASSHTASAFPDLSLTLPRLRSALTVQQLLSAREALASFGLFPPRSLARLAPCSEWNGAPTDGLPGTPGCSLTGEGAFAVLVQQQGYVSECSVALWPVPWPRGGSACCVASQADVSCVSLGGGAVSLREPGPAQVRRAQVVGVVSPWEPDPAQVRRAQVVGVVSPREPGPAQPLSDLYPSPHSDLHPSPHSDLHPSPHSDLHPSPHSDLHPSPHSDLHPSPHSDLHPSPHSDLHPSPHSDLHPSPPSDLHPSPHSDLHPSPPSDLHPSPPSDLHPSPPSDLHPKRPSDLHPSPLVT